MKKIRVILSSDIEAIDYDDFTRLLTIRFGDGAVNQYSNVALHTYTAFTQTDSKGRFFNRHIRGIYDARAIDDELTLPVM